jgi:hypothetical protein
MTAVVALASLWLARRLPARTVPALRATGGPEAPAA